MSLGQIKFRNYFKQGNKFHLKICLKVRMKTSYFEIQVLTTVEMETFSFNQETYKQTHFRLQASAHRVLKRRRM